MKKTTIFVGCVLLITISLVYGVRRRVPPIRERIEFLESVQSDLLSRVRALEEKLYGPGGEKKKFSGRLQVGQIAYLDKNSPRIEQILDKQNMLVEITIGERAYRSSTIPRESRFLTQIPMRYEPIKELVWIKGIDTFGLVDGKSVEIKQLMKITGTKTYETVMGSKTVFLFEPHKVENSATNH